MAGQSSAVPTRDALIAYAQRIALKYGLDPDIFVAQINQESGFNPDAINHQSGARGIAQQMPEYYPKAGQDPYLDLEAAAQTDANNLKTFNGDYSLMLAAYEAGTGAVQQAGGIPDYPETHRYVQNILQAAQHGRDTNPVMGTLQGGDQTTGNSVLTPEQLAAAMGPDYDQSSVGAGLDPSQTFYGGAGQDIAPGLYSGQNWQNILQQHGGIVPGGINPTKQRQIPDPNELSTSGKKIWAPDPNAPSVITFNDGTVIFANIAGTDPNNPTSVQVVSSVKSGAGQSPKAIASGANDPFVLIFDPTAPKGQELQSIPNVNYNPKPPRVVVSGASSTDPFVAYQNPTTGEITWEPNKNYAAPKPQVIQNGGAIYVFDPNTGKLQQIQGPDAETQARIAQAQKNLLPAQQRLFDDARDSVDAISQAWASGRISSQERDQLTGEIWTGLQASMEGTTIFDKYKEQQTEAYNRAQEASSILQNRVTTGTTMAKDLLTAAAGHVMMGPGQTSLGIDPFAIAQAETSQLVGGQDVYNKAADVLKSFMSGYQSSQNAAPAPAPAGPGGNTGRNPLQDFLANALRGTGGMYPAESGVLPKNIPGGFNPEGPSNAIFNPANNEPVVTQPIPQPTIPLQGLEGPSVLNSLAQALLSGAGRS